MAPWAPMPGASSGPLTRPGPGRRRARARPTVAPTTAPTEPSGVGARVLRRRCGRATDLRHAATRRRSGAAAPRRPPGSTSAPARTPRARLAAPRPAPAAATRSPRYGLDGHRVGGQRRVRAEVRLRRRRPSSSRCRRAWRPSAPARRRPGRGHRALQDGDPARAEALEERRLRLEHRDLGRQRLHQVRANRSRPARRRSGPSAASSAGCGSMPTHSGPRLAWPRRSRAPKVGLTAAQLLVARSASTASARVAYGSAAVAGEPRATRRHQNGPR